MKIKRLIYYTTAVFIAGTMILIAMQYITSNNVQELISGNENLMNEFRLTSQLSELQKDMLVFDNTLKNAIITSDSIHIRYFGEGLAKIENDLSALENVTSNDSIRNYITGINNLVHQKLEFSNDLADSFYHNGKLAAEKLFATGKGIRLSQEIFLLAKKTDIARQRILLQATNNIDNSGRRAFRWGLITITAVLLLFTIIFWFIITRMKKQYDLNNKLNESEKKIKQIVEVKENFLANMSHEIRTPLNAILGYAGLLQRKPLDSDSALYLSTIRRSGENLLSIINDILDISKIEAGMMRIEEATFSLGDIIRSVEAMFKNKVEEKKLQLKIMVETGVTDILAGDATRLTQVLVNLLGNAVKFTDKGQIVLHVSQDFLNENTVTLLFKVIDPGIGIHKSALKTIFERFTQAEETITRKSGGTGLGLSIAKNIVELQNGTINIKSEPGIGTEVSFQIPFKISHDPVPFKEEINQGMMKFLAGLDVLVVEDNLINQTLLSHLFNEWKINFVLSNNGREALSVMDKRKFDLVLMDIQMPEMDGYTAAIQIREHRKLIVPIIAMTAFALAGEREKCLSVGMNGYITKPIKEQELYKLILEFAMSKKVAAEQIFPPAFSTVNTAYMQEISNGDLLYELTVTRQFISMLPEEIESLQKAFNEDDNVTMKQVAHNLKTTISVMGLNRLLDEHLDAVHDSRLSETTMNIHIQSIVLISEKAMAEAKILQGYLKNIYRPKAAEFMT